jgi:hypothetical protein
MVVMACDFKQQGNITYLLPLVVRYLPAVAAAAASTAYHPNTVLLLLLVMVVVIHAGTLQQAVICEALASTLIAPGLLYITRAHKTADLRTVAAISLFVVSIWCY